MIRKTIFSLAVLLLATAPLALAQGTYTQIDPPGSTRTNAYGVDTAGDVVGFYQDSSGDWNGFLLSAGDGTYTTIDYPGSTTTVLKGVNDLGQVVGTENAKYSFVYDLSSQSFTTVYYPGSYSTEVTSINNSGAIAGYMYVSKHSIFQGFELVDSTYSAIAPPNTLEVTMIENVSTRP